MSPPQHLQLAFRPKTSSYICWKCAFARDCHPRYTRRRWLSSTVNDHDGDKNYSQGDLLALAGRRKAYLDQTRAPELIAQEGEQAPSNQALVQVSNKLSGSARRVTYSESHEQTRGPQPGTFDRLNCPLAGPSVGRPIISLKETTVDTQRDRSFTFETISKNSRPGEDSSSRRMKDTGISHCGHRGQFSERQEYMIAYRFNEVRCVKRSIGSKGPGDIISISQVESPKKKDGARRTRRQPVELGESVRSKQDHEHRMTYDNLLDSLDLGRGSFGGAIQRLPLAPPDARRHETFPLFGALNSLSQGILTRNIQSRRISSSTKLGATVLTPENDLHFPAFGSDHRSIREYLRDWQKHYISVNPFMQPNPESDDFKDIDKDEVDEEESVMDDADAENTTYTHTFGYAEGESILLGDLIAHTKHGKWSLHIALFQFRGRVYTYSEKGQWGIVPVKRIRLRVPNFLGKDISDGLRHQLRKLEGFSFETLRHSELPSIPRGIASILLQRLNDFRLATGAVTREYTQAFSSIDKIVNSSSHEIASRFDIDALSTKIFGKRVSDLPPQMTLAMLQALDQYLSVGPLRLRDLTSSLSAEGAFDEFMEVIEWTRQHRENVCQRSRNQAETLVNPLSTFIRKCQRRIQLSRMQRPLTKDGTIQYLSHAYPKHLASACHDSMVSDVDEFTADDLKIGRFIQTWGQRQMSGRRFGMEANASYILRATGMYPDMLLSEFQSMTFLQEIGMAKPAELVGDFVPTVLPGRRFISKHLDQLQDCARESMTAVALQDSMADMRRDWGEMPVFCIDAGSTTIRDDGISIESIEGEPSQFWMHTHVAHPSAHLRPEVPISRFAVEMGATLHGYSRTTHMIPREISNHHLGIAANRPCITFSTRVSLQGRILEHKITPGIVRNVYFVTQAQIEEILGPQDSKPLRETPLKSILQIGGTSTASSTSVPHGEPERRPLGMAEANIFRLMEMLTKRLREKRLASPDRYSWEKIMRTRTGRYTPRLFLPNFPNKQDSPPMQHESENPTVVVNAPEDSIDDNCVQEFMLQACFNCASWCADRGIPIAYRGHIPRKGQLMSSDEFWLKHIQPQQNDPTSLLFELRHILKGLDGTISLSPNPIPQKSLGLEFPVYAQVTSPLRRASDLLAQWQIDACLRYEHISGKSLAGTGPDFWGANPGILPFTQSQVSSLCIQFRSREKELKKHKGLHDRGWNALALHDAFYFQREKLPPIFRADVMDTRNSRHVRLRLAGWNFVGYMSCDSISQLGEECHLGDMWEVELETVYPWHTPTVDCKPVRRLSKGLSMDIPLSEFTDLPRFSSSL